MEIWLNCINLVPKHFSENIDKILSKKEIDAPIEEIIIKDDFKLEQNGKQIGKVIINKKYPFALIKFNDENFNFDKKLNCGYGSIKTLKPVWLK